MTHGGNITINGETSCPISKLEDSATVRTRCSIDDLKILSRVNRIDNSGKPTANFEPTSNNTWIPAGYTYLAQLLAHDMTLRPAELARRYRKPIRNRRTPSLDLDCLYGGGPDVSRHLFQNSIKSEYPTKFKVGLSENGKFADIPRVCVNSPDNWIEKGNVPVYEKPDQRRFDPIVADARNDDNLITSQITMLFLQLHNRIVELLPSNLNNHDTFQLARSLTIHCYRTVIVQDLMFRWLDPQIYKQELEKTDLIGGSGVRISERMREFFAFVAMRIGHSMVQPTYDVSNELTNSPAGRQLITELMRHVRADGIPLRQKWLIEWSLYFPKVKINGNKVGQPIGNDHNSSALIGLAYDSLLNRSDADIWPLHVQDVRDIGGLAYIDLLRSCRKRWPTGQMYAKGIGIDVIKPDAIKKILSKYLKIDTLETATLKKITTETPFLTYLLIESVASQWKGTRIGEIGSIIIAQNVSAGLKPIGYPSKLKSHCIKLFGTDTPPRWMPNLINWINTGSQYPTS